jgi:hypothetical protein
MRHPRALGEAAFEVVRNRPVYELRACEHARHRGLFFRADYRPAERNDSRLAHQIR